MDGVMGHHTGPADPEAELGRVLALLVGTRGRWRRTAARDALYDELRDGRVLAFVDELLARIEDARVHHDLASWLVRQGEHREPVKFGMALLGRAATAEDLDVLRVLGRHEEFTLYAAVALARQADDPEGELWRLARGVDGWGRVHVIERLAGTERPDIKGWLLRGGFRNSVMDEYTAYTAATTGDLAAALEGPVDPELLAGAVGILRALLAGGPAEDIGDYADGPRALRMVLELVREHPTTAEQGLLAVEVVALLDDPEGGRVDHWTVEARTNLLQLARDVLALHVWPGIVQAGLTSEDTFWAADQLAGHLGVDTFPALLARLRTDPFDRYWWQAMRRVDERGLPTLLDIADEHLLPSVLGTGAALDLGLGQTYREHSALEMLVTGLERFPGRGWPHVRTALSSPVIRSRNMALHTLAAWGSESWPRDVRPALQAAQSVEPDDGVRRRIERLLAGQPLDGEVEDEP
jgi:hypothetical protein